MVSHPLLSPQQQIEHLEEQGIAFNLWGKSNALQYLRDNTNYFRLKSYKDGFERVVGGKNDGKYLHLDFAMLVDLSIIDMLLRNELLPMTLDIEHYAKVNLMNALEAHGDDGYALVNAFVCSNGRMDESENPVLRDISRGKSSPFVSNIVSAHPDYDYPVWEFVEVIPFGTFLRFYRYCADEFADRGMRDTYYCLQGVKVMRNGCAHNNCILNDMRRWADARRPQHVVVRSLASIGVSSEMRRTKLSNERFQQIATTFYMHKTYASPGVLKHRARSLWEFTTRMNKHVDYYDHNEQVRSGFAFIEKIVSGWYPKSLFGEES